MSPEPGRDNGEDVNGASGPGPPESTLSLNALLEVLAHHHRRETLRTLIDDPSDTATIDQLTARLIEREAERTGERPGQNELEIQLYHVHLPKLIETGLVEYDVRSKELRYWHHERLEELLEYLESRESS